MGAKRIFVCGDSKLVIKQVKREYQVKHPRMRAYRNAILDILKTLPEYTLTAVSRSKNIIVDSLATATSNLKIPMNSSNKFEIHVKHRPIVLDNLRYWQVFWDDNEINSFFQNEGKFKNAFIDVCDSNEQGIEANQMDVLQLKDNVIPRGIIPLEELFDQDDVARKQTLVPTDKGVEDVNIGIADQPKLVKLSKTLSLESKVKYVKVLSKFLMFLHGITQI